MSSVAPVAGAASAETPAGQEFAGRWRDALFVAIFLLGWVSVSPFQALSNAKLLEVGDTSDTLNQIAYVTLATCAVAFFLRRPHALSLLLRPAYIAMSAWLLVSVATSNHPALSLRRLIFTGCVILLAAAAPLLPSDRRRFVELISASILIVLALCYVGAALFPEVSIHQADDLVEPRLAGNWRGLFDHKNIAGEMMAIFVFVGLFIARVRSAGLGWSIVLAAAFFLLFTEAKAAMGFLVLVLILSPVVTGKGRFGLRIAVPLALWAGLNVLTVGSLFSPALKTINDLALSDPTFTGRNDIWQFATQHIPERALLGHGFGAFWETDEIVYGDSMVKGDGPVSASHAHHALLDLALTTGIPGVALALLWAVAAPVRDLRLCLAQGADSDLIMLFLRIWLFALFNCIFESILFARGDPLWFSMLVAMFGLRYLSTWRLIA
ncbi:MAG: O-antigen ligase family protein [Methylobacteriaceae bacterium]|nr:O-antigen ligase family protein [Methylobacteriaceae bacterium]